MKLHLHKGQDFSVILARNKNRKNGPYESARSYLCLSAQNLEPSIVLKARGRNPSGPKNIVKPLIPIFELHDYMVSIRQREKNLKQLEHYNHALWHPGASQQLSNDSLLEWIKWCLQSWNTETHKKNEAFQRNLILITLYNTQMVTLLCAIFQCSSWTYRLCTIIYVPACLRKLSPLLLP